MKNQELIKIFYDIAEILEIKKIEWKPRAYRKAALSIQSLSEDIEDIYKEKGLAGLKEIPGIGDAISQKIAEYIETGKIHEYEKLKESIPPHLTELSKIGGLGPKRAQFLFEELKIKNIKDLERATKKDEIAKLPTFGIKSQENIKKGLELYKKGQERRLLGYVLPIAEELKAELDKLKEINKIDIAGSVRRRKETIKDIDILIIGKNKERIMDYFTSLPVVSRILAKGYTRSSVILTNNMQADLRVLDPRNYGAALNYFTGSKEHNVRLRQIAIKKGYKFSEYGLFNRKTNRYIAGRTEQEVYKKLGLKYVEPELREDMGELDSEINKHLPKLITLKDIKGDLHSHTKATDGANTIEEMALAAKKRNYKYLSISDHSKSTRVANGLNEKDLSEHLKKIDKINNKINGITLLKSSEVDILKDGSLDYNDKLLKQMDMVLCSIHSGFKQDKAAMTKRLIKAIENPYTNIIGHPSGRLINRRDPYEFDIDKVFEVAKDNNVAFEINSQPDRLDLKDIYIKKAVENKVKLVINSDAHSAGNLWLIEFGIMQARRGWAEKKDIINTFPLRKLSKIFTNIKH